jgi:hypothetical protein
MPRWSTRHSTRQSTKANKGCADGSHPFPRSTSDHVTEGSLSKSFVLFTAGMATSGTYELAFVFDGGGMSSISTPWFGASSVHSSCGILLDPPSALPTKAASLLPPAATPVPPPSPRSLPSPLWPCVFPSSVPCSLATSS